MTTRKLNYILIIASVFLASCASPPQNPSEVVDSLKFGHKVVWIGQFAFAKQTTTAKGEPLVIGVFRYLKADVSEFSADFSKAKFPIVAKEVDNGYFSIDTVFPRKDVKAANKIQQNYEKLSPFVLVKGTPENVIEVKARSVVRLRVEKAMAIKKNQIKLTAD